MRCRLGGWKHKRVVPICASSQVVSNIRRECLAVLYCTVLSFACSTNPGAAKALVHTTSDHSCYDVQAPQSSEPGGARSPSTHKVQAVRCATNTRISSYPCFKPPTNKHHQSHLRQPAILCSAETFLDPAYCFPTASTQRLSHSSRLLNRGAHPSSAPSSFSGTATCRFVHTDGADRT